MGTIVSFNKTLESRGTDASNSKGQKHACSGVKSTEQGARHVPNTVSNHNDLLNKYEKSKSPPPGHDLSHQDASKNLVKPQDTTCSSQGGGIPPESKAMRRTVPFLKARRTRKRTSSVPRRNGPSDEQRRCASAEIRA